MLIHTQNSYEYKNDFLYFIITPDEDTEGAFLFCSGVNVDRFLPITKGRHNPMSNPAIRGLQLIQYDIMALVIANGATSKVVGGSKCTGMVPSKELWSREGLLIMGGDSSLPDKIIKHSVVELLKKIDKAIMLGASMPDTLLGPDELQVFLETLCRQYAKQSTET